MSVSGLVGAAGVGPASLTVLGKNRGHGGGAAGRGAQTPTASSTSTAAAFLLLYLLRGLVLGLPLQLVAVVLEPDLNLVGGEVDQSGQVLPLRCR